MILVKTKESEITNNYHPIIYLLIILLKQNKDKHTKCYRMLKKYLENYDIKLSDIENINIQLENNEIEHSNNYNNIYNNNNNNTYNNNEYNNGIHNDNGNNNDSDNESSDSEEYNFDEININDLNSVLKNLEINKVNQSSNQEADYKYDIIDIIYQCMEDYGSMVVDKARLITIKNYYSKSYLTSQIIFNIFIVLYLGYLVFSEDEWYKFSYSRHGWEIISAYDLAKEINMGLVNKLTKLCNECKFKLENLPTKLFSFMSGHSVTFKNLYQLETFFYLDNFISRMDKSKVLRFEDCECQNFCLKSTNYNFHSENKNKVKEVKEFFEDIFVDKELIQYVLKILASTLTYGNKLRAIVFFIGSGRNGKTTLTNMLRLSLGDYAATPNVSLFLGKSVSADKPSPQMVDLNCARVAICEEPDARSIAITGDTKAITGNDVQAVSVDLLPIINTNDKLTISNLDNALIDRILMNISVLSSTQNINNPSIKELIQDGKVSRVQGYAEALIHLLIENYQEDYTSLEIPESVVNATKSFIMRKYCDKNDNHAIPIDELYTVYKNWFKQYVSTRSVFYSLEDFRMDLIKYSIRIKNLSSNSDSDSKKTVESIIGYRFI
ncbi:hypothetical protein H8356DRAFT_1340708 [Neocallimastix lanati (nom. inval.)]|nr:hypothetical protein H8356DRAFT_1340708 [Neocallimastix sp. JGI-2020a]